MTRFVSQTSWARGEVEPRLVARQDADFYASAAARLENFLPDAVAGISVRANFLSLGKIPRQLQRVSAAPEGFGVAQVPPPMAPMSSPGGFSATVSPPGINYTWDTANRGPVENLSCSSGSLYIQGSVVTGVNMDPAYPYLLGQFGPHVGGWVSEGQFGPLQDMYYEGEYIGKAGLEWSSTWGEPDSQIELVLGFYMESQCKPFNWSGNLTLQLFEASDRTLGNNPANKTYPRGRSTEITVPVQIDFGTGASPGPPTPPDPDPGPGPSPVTPGDLHLLPNHQNLLGYVYRGVQALVHMGVYESDDGQYYIAVRPYQAELSQVDTDSPIALDTELVGGEVFLSAPFSTLTPRLLYETGFAVAGPAAFITHRLLPPLRVFPTNDETAPFDVTPVSFSQELYGFATIKHGENKFEGDQDALFDEQLQAGDKVQFRNVVYTVEATGVVQDEEADDYLHHYFTVEETYQGETLTDRVDLAIADPFDSEHPRLVAFYQGRLVLAATDTKPTGVWLSRAGDPYVIVPSSVDDASPINQELLAEGSDEFVWMTGGDRLYLGSGLGEYALGSPEETLAPTQLRFFRIGQNGGAKMTPEVVDGTVIFANRSRSQMLGVVYDLGRQAFNTSNMSLLSGHLSEGVVDVAYRPPVRNDRTPRIFVLTSGGLRAFALSEAAGVAAWSRVEHSPAFSVQAIAGTSEYLFSICNRYNGQVDLAVLRNE